jgi:hypothetical protein
MTFEQTDLGAQTRYWVQNAGSPMGSSIHSIAAEIFIPNTEENLYPELTETQSVGRYVVHIFTI